MRRAKQQSIRRGFTLVEVLVTTVVIGVLAGVVVPAMVRQVTAGDPVKMASDLTNIKMGIEMFSMNVRPYFPGDLEDMVKPITEAADGYLSSSGGTTADYPTTAESDWNGPYIARMIDGTGAVTGSSGWPTGSDGNIEADLFVCSTATGIGCVTTTAGSSDYVSIRLNAITASEFAELNEVIDGTETTTSSTGMLRYFTSGTLSQVYFLAAPYTAP